MKKIDKFYKITFLLILIVFFVTIFFAIKLKLGISNSFIPEIFGFALDGLFFVLIFSIYEKQRQKSSEITYKTRLKNTFLAQLEAIRHWATYPEYDDKFDIEQMTPREIVDQLWKTGEIEGCAENFVKKMALESQPFLNSMNPIVAMLDEEHFTYWMLLLNSVNSMATSKDEEHFHEWIYRFLTYFKEFKELPVSR